MWDNNELFCVHFHGNSYLKKSFRTNSILVSPTSPPPHPPPPKNLGLPQVLLVCATEASQTESSYFKTHGIKQPQLTSLPYSKANDFYYFMESLCQVNLGEESLPQVNSTSGSKSSTNVGNIVGGQRFSGFSEQANVNIILHNEFEKTCPPNDSLNLTRVSKPQIS